MFWFKNKNNFILNIFSIYFYDLASLEKKSNSEGKQLK